MRRPISRQRLLRGEYKSPDRSVNESSDKFPMCDVKVPVGIRQVAHGFEGCLFRDVAD
jgi:hypothetical protein